MHQYLKNRCLFPFLVL